MCNLLIDIGKICHAERNLKKNPKLLEETFGSIREINLKKDENGPRTAYFNHGVKIKI